jgi:hypothetical protein
VHALPSDPVKPILHLQLDNVPLPCGDEAPAGQDTQALLEIAASDVEYVPASHSMHAAEPGDLYLPRVHDWQVSPLAAEYPALQRQSDASVLACVDPAFSEQSAHDSEPALALYFPALHAVHVPPSGPE